MQDTWGDSHRRSMGLLTWELEGRILQVQKREWSREGLQRPVFHIRERGDIEHGCNFRHLRNGKRNGYKATDCVGHYTNSSSLGYVLLAMKKGFIHSLTYPFIHSLLFVFFNRNDIVRYDSQGDHLVFSCRELGRRRQQRRPHGM